MPEKMLQKSKKSVIGIIGKMAKAHNKACAAKKQPR